MIERKVAGKVRNRNQDPSSLPFKTRFSIHQSAGAPSRKRGIFQLVGTDLAILSVPAHAHLDFPFPNSRKPNTRPKRLRYSPCPPLALIQDTKTTSDIPGQRTNSSTLVNFIGVGGHSPAGRARWGGHEEDGYRSAGGSGGGWSRFTPPSLSQSHGGTYFRCSPTACCRHFRICESPYMDKRLRQVVVRQASQGISDCGFYLDYLG